MQNDNIHWSETHFSPAEASNEHTHYEWPQQTSDRKDRHGEGVHEGQGLLGQPGSITTQHGFVVELLDVLAV